MKIQGIKNFSYKEFFSEFFYNKFKNRPYFLINHISPKLPELAQFVRDRYKKSVTINNWPWRIKSDYPYEYSGYREDRIMVGSRFSRHRLGLCIDIKVAGIPAAEVQKDITDNYDIFENVGLTAIEADTPTWTHLSVEYTGWRKEKGLWRIPNPTKKEEVTKRGDEK